MSIYEKPMAAEGLTSYRYKHKYGYMMIGACDHEDALNEARRGCNPDPVLKENLDIWDDVRLKYVSAFPHS